MNSLGSHLLATKGTRNTRRQCAQLCFVGGFSCRSLVWLVCRWSKFRRFDTSRSMNRYPNWLPRRSVLILLAVTFAFAGSATFVRPAAAQSQAPIQVTFRQQLQFGLRARTAEEFAYVNTVVGLVQSGALPQQTVNRAFLWSRKKNHRYPFPYFSRALLILANAEGITIPPGPYHFR